MDMADIISIPLRLTLLFRGLVCGCCPSSDFAFPSRPQQLWQYGAYQHRMSYLILTHLPVKVSLATVFASWFSIYIYKFKKIIFVNEVCLICQARSGSRRHFMQSLEPFFHLLASTCVICVYRMKTASMSPSSDYGRWCVPTSIALVCRYTQSAAQVRQAHVARSVFMKSCRLGSTWKHGDNAGPEELWDSKEDVVQTSSFIIAIKLDVWGQYWNAEEAEGTAISKEEPLCACLSVCLSVCSPWYKRNGCLGLKHLVAYLITVCLCVYLCMYGSCFRTLAIILFQIIFISFSFSKNPTISSSSFLFHQRKGKHYPVHRSAVFLSGWK